MTQKTAAASVIVQPPLAVLIAVLAGFALQWAWPSVLLREISDLPRYIAGAVLLVPAAFLLGSGGTGFIRAGTPVRPWRASTALVTAGVYAHARNPMYVGAFLLLLGLALVLGVDWLVLTDALLVPTIHFGVVLGEERYLETRFGEAYRAYKARVPRYGWRF